MSNHTLTHLIKTLPKTELHVHIEGTLEPELLFSIAKRNNIPLPYHDINHLKASYQFHDLQSFLDVYYLGASVLITEQDFYELTWAYLQYCAQENIVHTEIFFDPQTHTSRGVSFETVIKGISKALEHAQQSLGISSRLIMCFLRHLSEASAFETLNNAKPYLAKITAIGLDSAEQNNPPEKFERVFKAAQQLGLLTVAHAGEEGPANNIWKAIQVLNVNRIDHGITAEDDPLLINYLIENNMPLTICPLSNVKLKVFNGMKHHNILKLLDKGVLVTVNSDDPAYFGGYLTENYLALHHELDMNQAQTIQLIKNGFKASFLSEADKRRFIKEIDHYLDHNAIQ